MSKSDFIDAEIPKDEKQEKKSWWKSTKENFKKAWGNTKNSFDGMINNMNIQSAFNDKTFEFRIENPEDVMFTGDRIYGILDDSETYILFRNVKGINDKIKKGTMLAQVNTFNHYIITEVDEKIVHYPVMVKDQNVTVECLKVEINKR